MSIGMALVRRHSRRGELRAQEERLRAQAEQKSKK
jgi:hypothetical protein